VRICTDDAGHPSKPEGIEILQRISGSSDATRTSDLPANIAIHIGNDHFATTDVGNSKERGERKRDE
jgi:hypothetical protein